MEESIDPVRLLSVNKECLSGDRNDANSEKGVILATCTQRAGSKSRTDGILDRKTQPASGGCLCTRTDDEDWPILLGHATQANVGGKAGTFGHHRVVCRRKKNI